MSETSEIRIGGVARFSTCDWPERLTATVFMAGCPWRCSYCHNRHLHDIEAGSETWSQIVTFLEERRGLLDGVVFSGGEPTGCSALGRLISDVHEMGFEVAVHSAGPFPKHLEGLLPHLSWVGFDVKAPFGEYERVTGVKGSGELARRSLRALVDSGIDFETRTTVHPDVLSPDDLTRLAGEIASLGVKRWCVQAYRGEGTQHGLTPATLSESDVPKQARGAVIDFVFREA